MKFITKTHKLLPLFFLLYGCASNVDLKQEGIAQKIEKTKQKHANTPISAISNNNTELNKEINTENNYLYTSNTEIPLFINDFIKVNPKIKNPAYIAKILAQQVPNQTSIKLMMPAKEVSRKNWQVYRSKFIEPIRIKAGQEFMANNKVLLDKVQNEYGVDAFIIAAIIGVESIYGRYVGNFNVLNTLYTLAFYYPDTPNKISREIMFQKQLANYIIWAQEQGNNFNHYGSYAGAMGMPQFMPESIRQYAIDYDKDGIINLTGSIPDVVASVANFLKKHGWKTGEKVVLDIEPSYENIALLKANATGKPQANLTFNDLPSLNFDYKAIGLASNTPLLVIDLPSAYDVEYKLGLYNFYVLTRYNQSFFYALSVYELANAIKY